jgi:hypothetical protein
METARIEELLERLIDQNAELLDQYFGHFLSERG